MNIDILIEKAKYGDVDALAELIQSESANMYRTALAILLNEEDASDAVGDAVLVCFEKLHTLRDSRYFRTWLTRIVINKCYDIRKKNSQVQLTDEVREAVHEDRDYLELKEALNALDEKYRIPVVLFYFEGYKVKEIANILHISKTAVETRLYRARLLLRQMMAE